MSFSDLKAAGRYGKWMNVKTSFNKTKTKLIADNGLVLFHKIFIAIEKKSLIIAENEVIICTDIATLPIP